MSRNENFLDAALLRTMTLLSTLNVAAELAFGMRERKAGRDPAAENEDAVVRPELEDLCTTLRTLTFQLESSSALTTLVDTSDAAAVQAFSVQRYVDLVRLQKTNQLLHRMHQHLLSLYPAIDESLAEEARLLEIACAAARDAEPQYFAEQLHPFLQQLKPFLRAVSSS
ncbi:MAG: hypothetical protein AAF564_14960 [Bacteroidota bacterium]